MSVDVAPMTKPPRRPLRQRWGYGAGSENPTGAVSHPGFGVGSPLKILLVLLVLVSFALIPTFTYHLINVLVAHGHSPNGVGVGLLGIVMGITLAVELFAVMLVVAHAAALCGNRRSRSRFYRPYRSAPARQPGLHRMSKRRAVAYANAGFSAAEAQKLEFGARFERPTEEALMMLGALNCSAP